MIHDTGSGGEALGVTWQARAVPGDDPVASALAKPSVSVLFVDDCDHDAARIESALSRCRDFDADIDRIGDPAEAWRLWDQGIHDIALFDIWLGNGTSIELLSRLEQDASSRPVVVLTSLPCSEARAFASGCGDFLVHSKHDLSPAALALTLGSALALSCQRAVMLNSS